MKPQVGNKVHTGKNQDCCGPFRTAVVLSGPELRLAGERGPFLKGDFQVFMVHHRWT